jgi:hypothetical protein
MRAHSGFMLIQKLNIWIFVCMDLPFDSLMNAEMKMPIDKILTNIIFIGSDEN